MDFIVGALLFSVFFLLHALFKALIRPYPLRSIERRSAYFDLIHVPDRED